MRETGQRGGRGHINSLSDASQCDKPISWLHKTPFPEVVAVHQTLHSSIDPGCLSCAPGAKLGLWEKGTTPITRLDGRELVSAVPGRGLCHMGSAGQSPSLLFLGCPRVVDVANPLACPASVGLAGEGEP